MEFRSLSPRAAKIRDDHFQLNAEWGLSWSHGDQVRHDLMWQGDSPMKFVASPLEDWIEEHVELDGKNGFCAISQNDLQKGVTDLKTGKLLLAGASRRTPDVGKSNFLVEAFLSTAAGQTSGTIVSKGSGYTLDLDQAGNPRFTPRRGGARGPHGHCRR